MLATFSQLQRNDLVMAIPLANLADLSQELLHVSRLVTRDCI
jgi:hypothetical protein